jgi:acyl-CoA synthetase (AMP-forming)/AMP-acid ligase II
MIFSSPHQAVTIPETLITEFVLEHAHERGDKPALIEGLSGRTITYAQLPGIIRRLTSGFASHGLGKGDVLAIYSPNLPEYALAFHAVATLGGATTMVPPLFTDEEINTQLRDSGAKFLLTIPQLMDKARLAAAAANIAHIFVVGEAEGAIPFASLIANESALAPVKMNPREDVAALPYSSGTTGFPKGVMLTHYNLVSMLCQMQANDALAESDTLVCVVPMYHLYGLHVVANLGLREGATIVTLPRYELSQFLHVLEKYRVTVAPLVPPLVLALSRAPEVENYDFSNLRVIHCGAASLPDDIARACSRRLGCSIRYGYGLTEVSPLSHATAPFEEQKPGSVGYCLPNTECKIVDYETGEELGGHKGNDSA